MIKICSKGNPKTDDRDDGKCFWQHHGAREVGDQSDGYPGGDIQRMECTDCGEKWKSELPQ